MKKKIPNQFTKRFYMMVAGGIGIVAGIGFFALYLSTGAAFLGAFGVTCAVAGGFLLYHYWRKVEGEIALTKFGDFDTPVPAEAINCLNLYRDRVVFEHYVPADRNTPEGFPMECLNDHNKYWLNISDDNYNQEQTGLKPFMLPDNQFYDPVVFAERVLELPAHRRVMKRREKLPGVIKTALLVVTIIIIWILIVTTTGD